MQSTSLSLLPADDQFRRHLSNFLDLKSFKTTAKTIQNYGLVLNLFYEFSSGQWPPDLKTVIAWLASVSETCSEATVHSYWTHLRAFLNFYEKSGELTPDQNPVNKIKLLGLAPKPPKKKPQGFNLSGLDRLIDHLDDIGNELAIRDKALLLFTFGTGCRAGEVVRLQLPDLDPGQGVALIRAETSKSDESRLVAFDKAVAAAVSDWLSIRPLVEHFHVFTAFGGHSGLGSPLQPNALNQMLKRRCRQFDIQFSKYHGLRHSHGIYMSRQPGVSLSDVMAQLGHKSIETTAVYLLSEDADRLNAIRRAGIASAFKKPYS